MILHDNIQLYFFRIKFFETKLEKLTTIYVPIIGTLKELTTDELKNKKIDFGLELQSLSEYYKQEWMSDGVGEGSIIIGINDIKVNSISDVKKALSKNSEMVIKISIIKNNGEKMVYRFR